MKKIFILISIVFTFQVNAQTNLTEAVDFTVIDVEGNSFTLFDHLDNDKYVLLDFFTVGCGGCQDAAPHVQQTYEYFGCGNSNVDIIALNYGAYDPDIITFQNDYGLHTPAASGNDGGANEVHTAYGILIYPTFVLIGPNGSILKQHIYPAEFETFRTLIESVGGIPMDCTSGIEDEITEDQIHIYPNPATDILNIKTEGLENRKLNIRIYSTLGNLVLNLEDVFIYNEFQFSIGKLHEGIYLIEIIDIESQASSIEKLLIQ